MSDTIALWHVRRRAISCANAVRAVSEKDCCVLKLPKGFFERGGGGTEKTEACSECSGDSVRFLGW